MRGGKIVGLLRYRFTTVRLNWAMTECIGLVGTSGYACFRVPFYFGVKLLIAFFSLVFRQISILGDRQRQLHWLELFMHNF